MQETLIRIITGFTILLFFLGENQIYGNYYDGCDVCYDEFWFGADYLYWKINDSPEPVPLVISQPTIDGPYTTLLGDNDIDLGWRSGARFALGYWFDRGHCFGIEGSYFFLTRNSKEYTVASDASGSPRLRVPFFNIQTDLEDTIALATPGRFHGTALLKMNNAMQGAELNLIGIFSYLNCNTKLGWFFGFRWWNFDESFNFLVDSPVISPPSIYHYEDKFNVENNFYGGQTGISLDYDYCGININVKGKVALGSLSQETIIDGFFITDEFTGLPETFVGGFFALPTNIGKHKKTGYSIIPELNFNLGYQVIEGIILRLGYSVFYASNILYASKQIDRNINPTQSANILFSATPSLVGEPSPLPRFRSEGLCAHGANIGIEIKF